MVHLNGCIHAVCVNASLKSGKSVPSSLEIGEKGITFYRDVAKYGFLAWEKHINLAAWSKA